MQNSFYRPLRSTDASNRIARALKLHTQQVQAIKELS